MAIETQPCKPRAPLCQRDRVSIGSLNISDCQWPPSRHKIVVVLMVANCSFDQWHGSQLHCATTGSKTVAAKVVKHSDRGALHLIVVRVTAKSGGSQLKRAGRYRRA